MQTSEGKSYTYPDGVHYYTNLAGMLLFRFDYDNPATPVTVVSRLAIGDERICEPGTALMELANDAIDFGFEVTEADYLLVQNKQASI